MINFSLTDEQRHLQKAARDFAEREIRPVVQQIEATGERHPDPWPLCRELVRKGAGLGFLAMLVPEADGGQGRSCMDAVIVLEELGAADVAIAANYFNLTATLAQLVARHGTPEQRRRILARVNAGEPVVFSGALSEPNVAGSDLFCPTPDPKIGVQTTARRVGDTYGINGSKSAFVTNAGIADAYFVMARSTFDRPVAQSLSMLYVPADTPGLSFGKRTEMIGWKTSYHCEVYFEDVRVPADNLLGQEGQAGMIFASCPEISIGLAACYVGLARAAYEYALQYARQRVSWGQPIVQHQAVGLKLADMLVQTQAARLLVWDAAYAADTDPMLAATVKAPIAKTAAVDAAIHNAQKAVEILGGYGVTQEYQAGKYLNDAWIGYACDFTRDVLRLGLVNFM